MYGLVHAPPLDRQGLAWFNVEAPLRLADLRGRLVILDFWTFCCINCMHVLPTLRAVEEAYPNEVVVIGVHSPKFAAERDATNVAHAIARYDIRHPVVHDPDMSLWRAYAVRAWPTLMFVSPDGYVLGDLSGEPDRERLLTGIAEMIRTWKTEGLLKPAALSLSPVRAAAGRLSFPGKIKPVPTGAARRWAVADAGHHQIALFDDAGSEIGRFGSGKPGFADGTAAEASFRSPQGLAADSGALYVADTGNHAIRRVDLATGGVVTLAGLGERGRPLPTRAAPGRDCALASPWDLEIDGDRLMFANAGTHQLGQIDLTDASVQALAGSSAEDIEDGPALDARLAQPSGLALSPDRRTLYFADSETSAVRALSLGDPRRVSTLVGAGLFDFGHVNGPLADARLQHPLGLAWHRDGLVVADSYNGRLRRIDLAARTIEDVGEERFTCHDAVCRPAGEPAGVVGAGDGRLLMSDTNNHRIVEIDLAARATRTWAE